MSLQRRFGVFYVEKRTLIQDDFRHVLASMEFVPQEVKYQYWARPGDRVNRFKFVGTSPLFDELSDAEAPPEYDVNVMGDLEPGVRVKVVRMEGAVF